jgi:hypothetical protein
MKKELYNKLKIKYKLPEYDELNNEFELSAIEKDDFLLREIGRKIIDKLGNICGTLEGAVSGEAHPIAVIEFGNINESDMKKTMEIYKKLMYHIRHGQEVGVLCDDKKEAEFIKDFFKGWPSLKADIVKIFSKLKDSWKKEADEKDDSNIFG